MFMNKQTLDILKYMIDNKYTKTFEVFDKYMDSLVKQKDKK